MGFPQGFVLCKDCKERLKYAKKGEKARRKLIRNPSAPQTTKQQWKGAIARAMLHNPTLHESMMASGLSSVGYAFETQRQIGPYIADFIILPNVVVEVDGPIHEKRAEYDRNRDAYLLRKGYKVIRVKNSELSEDWEAVIDRISEVIQP